MGTYSTTAWQCYDHIMTGYDKLRQLLWHIMTWLWPCNNVLCSWVSSKVLPICLRVHFPITSLCYPSADTIHLKMSTVVLREKHLPLFPHSLSSILLLLTRLSWLAWHCITVVISPLGVKYNIADIFKCISIARVNSRFAAFEIVIVWSFQH